jgi:site-specific recombinase XerD
MIENDLEIIEDWLAERNLSKSTDQNYRCYLRRFAGWLKENSLDHQTVTVRQVKNWITSHEWGNSLAYQTAVSIRVFSVWRFGETCALSRLRLRQEDAGEQRTLNGVEVDRLWTYLNKSIQNRRTEDARLRARAILSVALDTGLRASELCRLEISRLSLEDWCLQVMGKGHKWRKCVISETTVRRLREWFAVRDTVARDDCKTVFCGLELNIGHKDAGKPMTRNSLFQVMHRLGKSTGMYLTVHCLRRTFATLAIRRGASTRLVQVQGGWSDIKLVERYTQALSPDDFVGYFPTEN